LQYHFAMPDESPRIEKLSQPAQPPHVEVQADIERKHRKLDDEEFKAKLEMTKAFCDTAKGYVQISSAALALPLFFQEAMLGKVRSDNGLLGSCPLGIDCLMGSFSRRDWVWDALSVAVHAKALGSISHG
jgi:hypothetical protein